MRLESRDPADYEILVGMQHIDDEDNIIYETMHQTVYNGYILAYISSAGDYNELPAKGEIDSVFPLACRSEINVTFCLLNM